MSMHSAGSGSPGSSSPGTGSPALPGSRTSPRPDPEGPSPLDWAKRRLTNRTTRRLSAAGQRAEHRLERLAPSWRVVEWPHTGLVNGSEDHAGFLAIGPGGVYAVSVVDQGRHRVMLAGDVVQIHGKRPPYVSQARKDAKAASTALSTVVGTTVPVVPVLTFVGSGSISAHGLPNGCLVVAHRELDRLLLAAGNKISEETAQKLADVASHPATWADRYRWYSDSQTASDKGSARR